MFNKLRKNSAETDTLNIEGLPVKHIVPAAWGALYITEGAEQEYGLLPLVPTVGELPVQGESRNQFTPNMRLYVAAPNELGENAEHGAGVVRAELTKDGIDMILTPPANVSDIQTAITTSFSSMLEANGVEVDISEIRNEHGIGFAEALQQDGPQLIAHGLAEQVSDAAGKYAFEWINRKFDDSYVRRVTGLGVFGTVYAGATYAAIDSLDFTADTSPVIGPLVTATFVAYRMRKEAKAYAHDKSGIRIVGADVAMHYGANVADTVHDAFCRSHFDARLNAADL